MFIDILVTLFQSIAFIYTINMCLKRKDIISKKNILCIILLTIIGYIFPYAIGNISINLFITHFFLAVTIWLFYKDQYIEALIAQNIIYSIMLICVFVFGNMIYGIFEQEFQMKLIKTFEVLFLYESKVIYIIQIILLCSFYKYRNRIKRIYSIIICEEYSKIILLILFIIPDFLVSFYLISYKKDVSRIKGFIVLAFFLLLILSIIYFIKIKEKSYKIYLLNEELQRVNKKLKVYKEEYGVKMLNLYEFALMGRNDYLKYSLKKIINDESEPTYENTRNTLLECATNYALNQGINVLVKDNSNYDRVAMPEIELYRIIINIVNNAIKAMKNKGNTIVAESYESSKSLIIKIQNDGEKIPDNLIEKIFEKGFTTKKNTEKDHGYGLNIVKELIDKYEGEISVVSNDVHTQFQIILPKIDIN